MQAIVQTAVDAIVTMDEQGCIMDFNPGAERMFGYRAQEVIGRDVSCLMPEPETSHHPEYVKRYLRGAPPAIIGKGRNVTAKRSNGECFPAHLSIGEASLEHGRLFIGIMRDMTQHWQLEQELLQHRDHLQSLVTDRTQELATANANLKAEVAERQHREQLIQNYAERIQDLYNHAPCGYHSLAADGTIIKINDTELQWLGYSRLEVEGRMNFLDLLQPDCATNFQTSFSQLKQQGQITDIEFNLKCKDGASLPALVRASSVRDHDGEFVYSRTTVFDIRQRKHFENILFEEKERLQVILQAITDGVIYTNEAHIIQFVNRSAEALIDLAATEMVNQPLPAILTLLDDTTQQRLDVIAQLPVDPTCQPARAKPALLKKRVGQLIAIDFTSELTRKASGTSGGIVIVLHDATEERKRTKQLSFEASHDALTGLPNRSLFNHLLRHQIEHAQRHHETFGLLFLDLDGFKPVNDTLGHHAGDILLCMVASRLSQCVRSEDAVARYSGDEFTVILNSDNAQQDCAFVAERILKALNERFQIDDKDTHISASIGISLFPVDAITIETLIEMADQAMYRAKKMGGNQYVFSAANANSKVLS
ncbi:diguanylate cyclase [Chitinivorax sp. B]|uniref:sensor domain-containing protein n=1 Tax=Chitinivorax sp. B TaxID=2502235 RepID=UPI0014852839|nr:diguanylate cyclase [Chitinivorax sp. B]